MTDETAQEKNLRNYRVQNRYDDLMRVGKHGHYETMFRVVREEVERERAAHQQPEGAPAPLPSGWMLVPVEATPEMGHAAERFAETTQDRPKGAWWWRRLIEAGNAAAEAVPAPAPSADVLRDALLLLEQWLDLDAILSGAARRAAREALTAATARYLNARAALSAKDSPAAGGGEG